MRRNSSRNSGKPTLTPSVKFQKNPRDLVNPKESLFKRPGGFTLQGWRKINLCAGRNLNETQLEVEFGNMIVSCPQKEAKELLLVIRLDGTPGVPGWSRSP